MAKTFETFDRNFTAWTDSPGVTPLNSSQYREMMGDSAFAPCPMGRINLESFRLYEALESGSIPIVEARWRFDYFRQLLGEHPIPTVASWDEAADLVRDYLANPLRLDNKQQEIRDWWCNYKGQLRNRIIAFARSRLSSNAHRRSVRWPYYLPLWQPAELARHHSPKALTRRFRTQARRLAGTATP